MRQIRLLGSLVIFSLLTGSFNAFAGESESRLVKINNQTIPYRVETLSDGLNHPWSVAVISSNEALITERSGQLRRWLKGTLSKPIEGVPKVFSNSQGGLLDVILHPDFKNNQRILLSFAHGKMNSNTTRVVSAKLNDKTLSDIQIITDVEPYKDTPVHYGGRMVVLPDNTLLITTGDGFDYREQAQVLSSMMGKVLRLTLNGGIPKDNPFFSTAESRKEIWTFGHRNPQGLAYDPKRNSVWMHEHGPKGGDEINRLEAGKNYGWPVITYGKDYSGANISPFTEYEGMEQPLVNWTPSIAPSGLAVYYGDEFPELNGALLVGALVDRELRIVLFDGAQPGKQVSMLSEMNERIRDVRVGSDGAIYVLTDSVEGKFLRITRE